MEHNSSSEENSSSSEEEQQEKNVKKTQPKPTFDFSKLNPIPKKKPLILQGSFNNLQPIPLKKPVALPITNFKLNSIPKRDFGTTKKEETDKFKKSLVVPGTTVQQIVSEAAVKTIIVTITDKQHVQNVKIFKALLKQISELITYLDNVKTQEQNNKTHLNLSKSIEEMDSVIQEVEKLSTKLKIKLNEMKKEEQLIDEGKVSPTDAANYIAAYQYNTEEAFKQKYKLNSKIRQIKELDEKEKLEKEKLEKEKLEKEKFKKQKKSKVIAPIDVSILSKVPELTAEDNSRNTKTLKEIKRDVKNLIEFQSVLELIAINSKKTYPKDKIFIVQIDSFINELSNIRKSLIKKEEEITLILTQIAEKKYDMLTLSKNIEAYGKFINDNQDDIDSIRFKIQEMNENDSGKKLISLEEITKEIKRKI